jgi:cobalamin biosynthesis Mg chelatase CobN
MKSTEREWENTKKKWAGVKNKLRKPDGSFDIKELLFKCGLGAAVALFMLALYFNNQSLIENMARDQVNRAQKVAADEDAAENESSSAAAENESATVAAENAAEVATETAGAAETTAERATEALTTAQTQTQATEARTTVQAAAQTTAQTQTSEQGQTQPERNRALNFTLYRADGGNAEFSDFRGEVVFLTFWTPGNPESAELLSALTGALADEAVSAAGGEGVRFLNVCVQGQEAEPGAESAAEPAAETVAGSATVGSDSFLDRDARLARLFLLKTYPTTYVFYPSGELCDYQKGILSAERVRELAAEASRANEYDKSEFDMEDNDEPS